jgi:hypothetical protein
MASSSRDLEDARDDMVRILSKLIKDVERFDATVVLQRTLLEQGGAPAGMVDDEQLNSELERLNLEAAEMVTSVRQALEQLRRLS